MRIPTSLSRPLPAFVLPALFLFTLSLFVSFLIASAVPYGIIQADTGSYLVYPAAHHLFQPNWNDWARTPIFGVVMAFCRLFREPTVAFYWLNSLLFATSLVLVFALLTELTRRNDLSFLLTLFFLLIELIYMTTLMGNLFTDSDPLFSNLLFVGTLLGLLAMTRKHSGLFLLGCSILGVAFLTRPVGMALIPLWLVTIWIFSRGIKHPRAIIAISILLLLGPQLVWSAHNLAFYGQFKSTGFGGRNILPRVLPLLQDSDHVFGTQEDNAGFIDAVRELERVFGKGYNDYSWKSSPEVPGPFNYLRPYTETFRETQGTMTPLQYSRSSFDLDTITIGVALRIIALHPVEYANMVREGYFSLYSIYVSGGTQKLNILRNPIPIYQETVRNTAFTVRKLLYPPDGIPDASTAHQKIGAVLGNLLIHRQPVWYLFLHEMTILPILFHLIAAGSIAALVWILRKRKREGTSPLRERQILYALCMLILFLTAASQFVLVSAVELPLERYSIPAELPLNLLIVLTLGVIITGLLRLKKGWYTDRSSDEHILFHKRPGDHRQQSRQKVR